jgi:transposase
MAWTELIRCGYKRSGGKYASDATDAERTLVATLTTAVRRLRMIKPCVVFDAMLYIATTGCKCHMLPNDFLPVSTVQRYFYDGSPFRHATHTLPDSRQRPTE